MTITPKQKKTFWICTGALVFVYYAPAVITTVDRSVSAGPASPTVTPQVSGAIAAAAPFRGMVGTFFARAPLPGHGFCGFKFELRQNLEKAGTFKGYVTLATPACRSRRGSGRPNIVAVNGMKTMSAILTGLPMEPGGIRFHVDDAFNTTGLLPKRLSFSSPWVRGSTRF